jgi:hypothetical protein
MLGDVHYLNSGDWIESLTAVVEHWDGRYELINYAGFLKDHPLPAEEPVEEPAEETMPAENSAFSESAMPGAQP